MKSFLATALLFACSALASPVTTKAKETCKAGTTTSSDGTSYTVTCNYDYPGGDISRTVLSSFSACIDLCEKTSQCVDVSYVSGVCYTKASLGTPSHTNGVWTARKTSLALTSGTQLCEDNTFTGSSEHSVSIIDGSVSARFGVYCGADLPGHDLANSTQFSLLGCVEECNQTKGCGGVAFVSPRCYMKKAVSTSNLTPVGYARSAVKIS